MEQQNMEHQGAVDHQGKTEYRNVVEQWTTRGIPQNTKGTLWNNGAREPYKNNWCFFKGI